MKLYQVGGSVRDQMLEVPCKDLDYAVEAPSFEAMREEILKRGYKIFLETPKYLTIRANGPNGAADFALCRKDGLYKDGRHPENVEPATILEDLARRDFTVNAMAVDVDTGELLDPFNGKADLKFMTLRCVGRPEDRFEEDRLRALRALRFSITRDFYPEIKTLAAVHNLKVEDYASISTDRIRDEVFKMFQHDSIGAMRWLIDFDEVLKLMRERGIWLKATVEKRTEIVEKKTEAGKLLDLLASKIEEGT